LAKLRFTQINKIINILALPQGSGFPLQSVIASGAWQSVEHIAEQAPNAGISAAILNAKKRHQFEFNLKLN